MNNKLIIYGAGEFAMQMHYYLTSDSKYKVVAFCAEKEFIQEDSLNGLPLIAFENIQDIYAPEEYCMLVAVGYSKMRNRRKMFEKAKNKGYELINYFHSSVVKSNLIFGENNIILPGCVVEPGVCIGDNNILWSMSLLGHHCKVGSHNYISAKCLVAGHTVIQNLCFIGNGVNMINGLVIENETCLGAGTNLRKSTKEFGLYVGNPARLIKFNTNGIEL